jgi:hypothetical protein
MLLLHMHMHMLLLHLHMIEEVRGMVSDVIRLDLSHIICKQSRPVLSHFRRCLCAAAAVSSWIYNSIPRRRDIMEINNAAADDRYRVSSTCAHKKTALTTCRCVLDSL